MTPHPACSLNCWQSNALLLCRRQDWLNRNLSNTSMLRIAPSSRTRLSSRSESGRQWQTRVALPAQGNFLGTIEGLAYLFGFAAAVTQFYVLSQKKG